MNKTRFSRLFLVLAALICGGAYLYLNDGSYEEVLDPDSALISTSDQNPDSATSTTDSETSTSDNSTDANPNSTDSDSATTDTVSYDQLATTYLEKLEVKGRAPKTGYSRDEFYSTWPTENGCNLRQRIIRRDFDESTLATDNCTVIAGTYYEPYTGTTKTFTERSQISSGIQIDHIVALSDAWQKGAQNLTADQRYNLATDPLNLIAADASANQGKSDGDAATWLPANKTFRCQYVARQISVKYKYSLWVTEAEKTAMKNVLANCPSEPVVGI